MNSFLSKSIVVALAGLLFGCGGGGGGGDNQPVTGTQSYPLQAAYKKNVDSALTSSYAITGMCDGAAISGEAEYVRSAPTTEPGGFEDVVPALKVTTTSTISYTPAPITPCQLGPDAGTTTVISYYDPADYTYLGSVSSDSNYYSYMEKPVNRLPTSVKVGETYQVGKEWVEDLDSRNPGNLVLVRGYTEGSYTVGADTIPNAAMITETVNINLADTRPGSTPGTWVLAATRQEKSRITIDGNLTPTSIILQSTSSSDQLIFTPN